MIPEIEAPPPKEAVEKYIKRNNGTLNLLFEPSADGQSAFLTFLKIKGPKEMLALAVTTDTVTLGRMQQPARLPKILIYGPKVTPAQTAEEIFSFLNEHYPDLNIDGVDLYDISEKGHPHLLAKISKRKGLSLYNS